MKKLKVFCLVFIITILTVSIFTVFGDDIQNKLLSWGYNIGSGIKDISDKYTTNEDGKIVSYVNDIPVYEDEIIERIEKNKVILDSMITTGNSTSLSWGLDPVDYVYREKFELNYAKINNIEVSEDELNEYTSYQKAGWESEDSKEFFEQYLKGREITKEEFYRDIAPSAYEKTLLKRKVREHILKNADMNDRDYETREKFLEKFYENNIQIKEIDENFIQDVKNKIFN